MCTSVYKLPFIPLLWAGDWRGAGRMSWVGERCRQRWAQVEFIGEEEEEEEEEKRGLETPAGWRREEEINEEDKWSERQVAVQYPLGDAASRKQLRGEVRLGEASGSCSVILSKQASGKLLHFVLSATEMWPRAAWGGNLMILRKTENQDPQYINARVFVSMKKDKQAEAVTEFQQQTSSGSIFSFVWQRQD